MVRPDPDISAIVVSPVSTSPRALMGRSDQSIEVQSDVDVTCTRSLEYLGPEVVSDDVDPSSVEPAPGRFGMAGTGPSVLASSDATVVGRGGEATDVGACVTIGGVTSTSSGGTAGWDRPTARRDAVIAASSEASEVVSSGADRTTTGAPPHGALLGIIRMASTTARLLSLTAVMTLRFP
jgi:hypothetical protein